MRVLGLDLVDCALEEWPTYRKLELMMAGKEAAYELLKRSIEGLTLVWEQTSPVLDHRLVTVVGPTYAPAAPSGS
jgi:hypothetical protein